MTAPHPQCQPGSAERLWCTACGTVTRDRKCDCNRWHNEMSREPHFVNYADAMQESARDLAAENDKLQARVEELTKAPKPVAWRWRYDGEGMWRYRSNKPAFADHADVACEPLYSLSLEGRGGAT